MAEAGFDAERLRRGARRRAAPRSSWSRARRCGMPPLMTPEAIAEELGGLAPASMHAADLAADALHRALGLAARDGAASARPTRRAGRWWP